MKRVLKTPRNSDVLPYPDSECSVHFQLYWCFICLLAAQSTEEEGGPFSYRPLSSDAPLRHPPGCYWMLMVERNFFSFAPLPIPFHWGKG